MKRRSFLKAAGGMVGGIALGAGGVNDVKAAVPEQEKSAMPQRILGRTGRKISVVGFPGLCMIHFDENDPDAWKKVVHDAFNRGVNYFDVAPAYGNGKAEKRLGIALEGIDRNKIFLACKTKMRDRAGARTELEQSLKLLRTDHFDLYQMHHIRTPDEVKQALAPGGAIETFLEAKKEGKVKYLGFSAHTTKGALEALKGFDFDTVMFPINLVEYYKIGFGREVLEQARKQGAAVLAIKAISRGAWPEGVQRTRRWWYRAMEEDDEIKLGFKFTLSQPGVVAGFSPAFADLLDKAIDAVKDFKPITSTETMHAQKLAESCLSVFKREEDMVAQNHRMHNAIFPDKAYYDYCPCSHA